MTETRLSEKETRVSKSSSVARLIFDRRKGDSAVFTHKKLCLVSWFLGNLRVLALWLELVAVIGVGSGVAGGD